jgi:hypothetical protein
MHPDWEHPWNDEVPGGRVKRSTSHVVMGLGWALVQTRYKQTLGDPQVVSHLLASTLTMAFGFSEKKLPDYMKETFVQDRIFFILFFGGDKCDKQWNIWE